MSEALGRSYADRETVVSQGESGDCMYVIQSGKVAVVRETHDGEVELATLGPGDFFGEMALFGREVRSATVRAIGQARILTVDKRTFLSRVHEDPSLAFRLVKKMSGRIRELDSEIVRLRQSPRP